MRFVCGTAILALLSAAAGDPPAPDPTVVLDTTGFWRMHHTLTPPVVEWDEGAAPLLMKAKWLNRPTSPPPADWAGADFDDAGWLRGPARMACDSPWLARLHLRGKFAVTDPAKVDGLKLTVGYRGGAVVRINGAEIARGQLPKGTLPPTTLPESYPEEAFVDPHGKLLGTIIEFYYSGKNGNHSSITYLPEYWAGRNAPEKKTAKDFPHFLPMDLINGFFE